MMKPGLYQQVLTALMESDPDSKRSLTQALYYDWQAGDLRRLPDESPAITIEQPGRPQRPELVRPQDVPHRKLVSTEGRAALIHAITHIEFNAINLGLDAVYRFREMPDAFISDWLQVASEEAYHFGLLEDRLQALGFGYGDFPAHNGLWEMAVKTDFDPMVRMALVPRVLEARGLDVTPAMMKKLTDAGDQETVACLEIILRDEIGHVAIGSRWFKYLCDQRKLNSVTTFRTLVDKYMKGALRGPFHIEARLQAGFTEEEIQGLEAMKGEYS
jgi:uncharacterized ferritin-like protein (DUF455 family)